MSTIIILQAAQLLAIIIFGFILYKKKVEVAPGPNDQRMLHEFKTDPLMDDIMEYTIDKGLRCAIRPGINDRMTLYYHDETDHSEYAVAELFTTEAPRGSVTFRKAFEELRRRVDMFIENKEDIKKEMREKLNVKNQ